MQNRNFTETKIAPGFTEGPAGVEQDDAELESRVAKAEPEKLIKEGSVVLKVAEPLVGLQQEQLLASKEIEAHTSLESGGEARQRMIENVLNNEVGLDDLLATAGLSNPEK